MDVPGAKGESARSGRRSRVVLTPRRWRQACGTISQVTGARKPDSPGRARRKPLKPIAQETPGCPAKPVVTESRVLFYFRTRGCGCGLTPGVSCALLRRKIFAKPGRKCAPRGCGYMSRRHCEERSDEAIHTSVFAGKWIASLAMTVTGVRGCLTIESKAEAIQLHRPLLDRFACARDDSASEFPQATSTT